MTIDYVGFAYAISIAGGGMFGYFKAGSLPSLGAGLVFGSILAYGAYQTSQNPRNIYLSLGTSAILTGVMGSRYYNTQKFMPSGLIALISLAVVLKLSYTGITNLIHSQKHR